MHFFVGQIQALFSSEHSYLAFQSIEQSRLFALIQSTSLLAPGNHRAIRCYKKAFTELAA